MNIRCTIGGESRVHIVGLYMPTRSNKTKSICHERWLFYLEELVLGIMTVGFIASGTLYYGFY